MECELYENTAVDLNKSFYVDNDLDLDLKQPEDSILEDTFIDMKFLSLNYKSETKKDTMLSNTVIPFFPSEKLLFETSDKSFRKKSLRKSKSTGNLKGVSKIRSHGKRVKKSLVRSKRVTSPSLQSGGLKYQLSDSMFVNKSKRTSTHNIKKSCLCQSCSKYFPKKYLSRHLFLSSCTINLKNIPTNKHGG